ncbi:hypothetical protein [Egicoccus sp. AB-alg6-2]|uniref:hypothetical protein n=1 Tax=Egicoccus sp. AB-alg6-2 TaxID=3242692 RepID=UPI00359CD1D4
MFRARPGLVRVLLLCLAVALGACGGDGGNQPDSVSWRNVDLDVPDDWYVYERSDVHLSLSNADLSPQTDDEEREAFVPPEDGVVAMAFTYEPDSSPAAWRRFVEQQDATLEADNRLTLDGDVPATQLIFSYETNGIPTREMVVLIPSRAIVVLSQPVPGPGDDDAPDVFLDHIETFLDVLESADFGQPVLD